MYSRGGSYVLQGVIIETPNNPQDNPQYPHKLLFEGQLQDDKYKNFIIAWNYLRMEENQTISRMDYPQEDLPI